MTTSTKWWRLGQTEHLPSKHCPNASDQRLRTCWPALKHPVDLRSETCSFLNGASAAVAACDSAERSRQSEARSARILATAPSPNPMMAGRRRCPGACQIRVRTKHNPCRQHSFTYRTRALTCVAFFPNQMQGEEECMFSRRSPVFTQQLDKRVLA